MNAYKREPIKLFIGDIVVFTTSLWLMLLVRHQAVPDVQLWIAHIVPFSFLFALWTSVFFISGLYGKHTLLFKAKLPGTIARVQIFNLILSITFFFFVPIVSIAPKTNLAIYLIISTVGIISWRLWGFPKISKTKPERAIVVGSGYEVRELVHEVNNNTRYELTFTDHINPDTISGNLLLETIRNTVNTHRATAIVIDSKNERVVPILPELYRFIFLDIRFVDMAQLYEEIFDRVPISFVRHNWLIDNVSLESGRLYDFFKRVSDVLASGILWILSLPLYPVVAFAIHVEDRGPIFFTQERIGKGGNVIRPTKFRTMNEGSEKVTKIGSFLRKTRIDELPQLWSVLRGDLSLIGPRPEIPRLVSVYEEEVPYYHIRHLIKPGLSGWAQIHQAMPPKFGKPHIDSTTTKLSYDLYYIKNRSIGVDIQIALYTIKTLVLRNGV